MNGALHRFLIYVLDILLFIGILQSSLFAGPFLQDVSTPGPQGASNVTQSSAAPGKPTLVSPVGRVLGSTIAYTWRHVPGATFYYLWVEAKWRPGGADRFQAWYTAEQAGCSAPGSQTCSVTVTAHWDVGDGRWWIQPWNADGFGPWSDPMNFKLNGIPGVCASENAGVTNLLFPFVSNQGGFDTGIAITNTGKDPLSTVGSAGTCKIHYYGAMASGGGLPAPQTTFTVQPGQMVAFAISQGGVPGSTSSAAGFQGYIIASCNFPYAHGFAFISDIGLRTFGSSYLALVVCNNRTPVEQLLQ